MPFATRSTLSLPSRCGCGRRRYLLAGGLGHPLPPLSAAPAAAGDDAAEVSPEEAERQRAAKRARAAAARPIIKPGSAILQVPLRGRERGAGVLHCWC